MRRPVTGPRDERRRASMRATALRHRAAVDSVAKADICMALAAGVVTPGEVKSTHGIADRELVRWMADSRMLGVQTRAMRLR